MAVAVDLNGLDVDDVAVELNLTREIPAGDHQPPALTSFAGDDRSRVRGGKQAAQSRFQPTGERDAGGRVLYRIECVPPWSGQIAASVRAVPVHPALSHPYELGLLTSL